MILTKMAASLSIGLTRRAITKTTSIPIIIASSNFISKAISPPNPVSPMFGTICKHNRSFSTTDDSNHGDDSDSSKPDPKEEMAAIIMKCIADSYQRHSFKVWEGVRGHPFGSENCAGFYEIKRIKHGLYVRMDFPGMNNENVKVSWEWPDLIVKGEAEKQCEHDSEGRSYEVRVHFGSPQLYNIRKWEAGMKYPTLTIVIPMKVMDEE